FLEGARGTGAMGSVWNSPAHRPPEPCCILWHEPVAPRHFRRASDEGFEQGSGAIDALLATSGGERLPERHAALGAHDDAAAMAGVAQQMPHRSLAQERPLLSAQFCRWCPPEPRMSYRRRRADRYGGAG